MGQFLADLGSMEAWAREVERQADRVDGTVRPCLSPLPAALPGSRSADVSGPVDDEIMAADRALVGALRQFGSALVTSARSYAGTDRAGRARLRAARGPIAQ